MKKVFTLYNSQAQEVLKPDTPHSSQATKSPSANDPKEDLLADTEFTKNAVQ